MVLFLGWECDSGSILKPRESWAAVCQTAVLQLATLPHPDSAAQLGAAARWFGFDFCTARDSLLHVTMLSFAWQCVQKSRDAKLEVQATARFSATDFCADFATTFQNSKSPSFVPPEPKLSREILIFSRNVPLDFCTILPILRVKLFCFRCKSFARHQLEF
jgi:hypothetical protein